MWCYFVQLKPNDKSLQFQIIPHDGVHIICCYIGLQYEACGDSLCGTFDSHHQIYFYCLFAHICLVSMYERCSNKQCYSEFAELPVATVNGNAWLFSATVLYKPGRAIRTYTWISNLGFLTVTLNWNKTGKLFWSHSSFRSGTFPVHNEHIFAGISDDVADCLSKLLPL